MTIDKKILDKLEQYCAYSERCAEDVQKKCTKLQLQSEDVAHYIKALQEGGFLNQKRYAEGFIKAKLQKGWGPVKIKHALSSKKISVEIYQDLLALIEPQSQLEKVRALAEKKKKSVKAANERERNMKIVRFLMGRGFSYDIIKKVI